MKSIVTTIIVTLMTATGLTLAGAAPAQAAEDCSHVVVTSAHPDYAYGWCDGLPSGKTVYRLNIKCHNAAGNLRGGVFGSWREEGGTSVADCTGLTPYYDTGSAKFQFA